RLVLRHHRRRQRAALPRRRGLRDLSRARLSHDLRRGLADLQEALHVDGRLYRRGEVRSIRKDADLGRSCRAHQMRLSLLRRRSRGAIAAQIYRAAFRAIECAETPRRLSGCAPRAERRAVGRAGTEPARAGCRLDDGAARGQAVSERALVRDRHRSGEQDRVLIADLSDKTLNFLVTPAKAGVQGNHWMPAFAGMTEKIRAKLEAIRAW